MMSSSFYDDIAICFVGRRIVITRDARARRRASRYHYYHMDAVSLSAFGRRLMIIISA